MDDDIQVLGAPEDLFDEEERILNRPITGRRDAEEVDEFAGERPLGRFGANDEPMPPLFKKTVTSANMAKAMREKNRENQRVQPAYDAIEAAINNGIIDGEEDEVLIDLSRYELSDGDIGKIKDSYASEGWKIKVGAEPYALTFSLP